jgi:hypothetical protein
LRLQQQEALGILGVNLIHSAFFLEESHSDVVARLMDTLSSLSIEIDMLRFNGPQLAHLDNRLLALELVKQSITEAVLFDPSGDVKQVNDTLFKTPVIVHRGTFRPITKANQEIIERSLVDFKKFPENKDLKPKIILEITMSALSEGGKLDTKDFLERVDTLSVLKHYVLISNHDYFYRVKAYLRRATDKMIAMVVGGALLEKIFDDEAYKDLRGGSLEGFGRLFDDQTRLFVYPYKSDAVCINTQSFFPKPPLNHLLQYLKAKNLILDLLSCDDVDTTIHSADVRELLEKKDPRWEAYVPEVVRDVIKSNKLFGY